MGRRAEETQLLARRHAESVALLKRNLTAAGILAATPGARAAKRGYTAIFGRDAVAFLEARREFVECGGVFVGGGCGSAAKSSGPGQELPLGRACLKMD